MANLLGDVDVTVATKHYTASLPQVKTTSRRKTRVLSPPLAKTTGKENGQGKISSAALSIPSPTADDIYEDGVFPSTIDNHNDNDNTTLPSSPLARATERKTAIPIKVEEEDDDGMEVAQAVGHASISVASVNMTASRPVPKIEEVELPTPTSSSPTRAPTEAINSSAWNDITSKLNVVSSSPNEPVAHGKLDAGDAVEADGSLHFFWLDYTELNGSLLLFGKVKDKRTGTFVSCFVKIDNVLRKLYFLPREHRHKFGRDTAEEIDMGDVYTEVDQMMTKLKVQMHKMKPCSRKYAFELPDIPKEADYLKLLYPYDKPTLPEGTQGETFSHVFGTNTSLFEQFVLWKDIMGPCWLKVEEADFTVVNNASWCKLELQVGKPNLITVLKDTDLEAPTLTLMSIALRTMMNVKDNKQEIMVASARIYENVSLTDTTPAEKLPCKTLTIVRPLPDGYPTGFKLDADKHIGTIKMEKTELGLLSLFLGHLQRVDPDVLIGHKLEDIDYSVLLSRLKDRKVPGWHRIGRLRRSDWPKNMGRGGGSFFAERQLVAGRLLCDLANDQGKVSHEFLTTCGFSY